jgi:hypothetical protein
MWTIYNSKNACVALLYQGRAVGTLNSANMSFDLSNFLNTPSINSKT